MPARGWAAGCVWCGLRQGRDYRTPLVLTILRPHAAGTEVSRKSGTKFAAHGARDFSPRLGRALRSPARGSPESAGLSADPVGHWRKYPARPPTFAVVDVPLSTGPRDLHGRLCGRISTSTHAVGLIPRQARSNRCRDVPAVWRSGVSAIIVQRRPACTRRRLSDGGIRARTQAIAAVATGRRAYRGIHGTGDQRCRIHVKASAGVSIDGSLPLRRCLGGCHLAAVDGLWGL